jgi:uncharacterized protein YjhX (UPF0386 family)
LNKKSQIRKNSLSKKKTAELEIFTQHGSVLQAVVLDLLEKIKAGETQAVMESIDDGVRRHCSSQCSRFNAKAGRYEP